MKLKLYATVDLSHNGCENIALWEVAYPIKEGNKFRVNSSLTNHPHYRVLQPAVDPIQKSGKCILLSPSGGGYNDCINKDNVSDFYFSDSVNGRHIINIATETLIEEVKELLNN